MHAGFYNLGGPAAFKGLRHRTERAPDCQIKTHSTLTHDEDDEDNVDDESDGANDDDDENDDMI